MSPIEVEVRILYHLLYVYYWHVLRRFEITTVINSPVRQPSWHIHLTYILKWAQKAIDDVWPSPETVASLKKQAIDATGSFYKLQEELATKGAYVLM